MSEQERPEWARLQDADGWGYIREISQFTRDTKGVRFFVTRGGECEAWQKSGRSTTVASLYLPSPEAALRVANAIAKELGGWPGETAPAKEGGDE